MTVSRSVADANSQVGFYADGSGDLSVADSVASQNAWRLFSYTKLYASDNLVVKNGTGVAQGGANAALSWGDNRVADNNVDGAFGGTIGKI